MCVLVCTHVNAYVYVCACVHACACMCVHVYACVCMCMHVYMHVNVNAHGCMCVHVDIVLVCSFVSLHSFTCIYTCWTENRLELDLSSKRCFFIYMYVDL